MTFALPPRRWALGARTQLIDTLGFLPTLAPALDYLTTVTEGLALIPAARGVGRPAAADRR